MEQHIRFCTTSDGVRIAYATVGQGPPVVASAPGSPTWSTSGRTRSGGLTSMGCPPVICWSAMTVAARGYRTTE